MGGRVRLVGIHKIRCKSRVVSEFPLFGGQLLRFLLLQEKSVVAHLLLPVHTRLRARLTGNARNRLPIGTVIAAAACWAGVAFARAGSPGVPSACSVPFCSAAAVWFLRSWTLLSVLSCRVGCGASWPCRRLLRGSLLACPAEYRRDNEKQYRAEIDQRLQILPQDTLRFVVLEPVPAPAASRPAS